MLKDQITVYYLSSISAAQVVSQNFKSNSVFKRFSFFNSLLLIYLINPFFLLFQTQF